MGKCLPQGSTYTTDREVNNLAVRVKIKKDGVMVPCPVNGQKMIPFDKRWSSGPVTMIIIQGKKGRLTLRVEHTNTGTLMCSEKVQINETYIIGLWAINKSS